MFSPILVTSARVPFSTRGMPWLAVLGGEGDEVALAEPVVLVGQLDSSVSEFAALGPEVLGAGVETVDLHVRAVGDQRDAADGAGLGELCPPLDGGLACLLAGRH